MPVRSKIALPASREMRSIPYSAGSDIGTSGALGVATVGGDPSGSVTGCVW